MPYDYNRNYIFAEPIKEVKDETITIVTTFQNAFQVLEYKGLKPNLNIANNQAVLKP